MSSIERRLADIKDRLDSIERRLDSIQYFNEETETIIIQIREKEIPAVRAEVLDEVYAIRDRLDELEPEEEAPSTIELDMNGDPVYRR